MLVLPPSIAPLVTSYQPVNAYPMGMSFFPLDSVYFTDEVLGVVTVSSMYIGNSYLPNGQFFATGNASLQLNAMVDGLYWAQDVALFHQVDNRTFDVTLVVNVWDLAGPFRFNVSEGNVSTYNGLGVICYVGPTYEVTAPFSLSLFMVDNSSALYFGFKLGNHTGVYYTVPIRGQFQIGGISALGVPNDLELVFGGPGGGSVVQMYVEGTEELYFDNGGVLQVVPQAFSVGLDTAESVVGVRSVGNVSDIYSPFAQLNRGSDDLAVLWPVKPQLNVEYDNSTVTVELTYEGKPISGQEVELEEFSFPSVLRVADVGVTNSSGSVTFRYNSSDFVVYYPGNFSLSSTYYISAPYITSAAKSLTSAYDSLLSFITHYNFKKGIASFFGDRSSIEYKSEVPADYLLLMYVSAFAVGVVISALLLKFKH